MPDRRPRALLMWALLLAGPPVLIGAFLLDARRSARRDAELQAQIDRADAERRVLQAQNVRSIADRAGLHAGLDAALVGHATIVRKLDRIADRLGIPAEAAENPGHHGAEP